MSEDMKKFTKLDKDIKLVCKPNDLGKFAINKLAVNKLGTMMDD